MYIFGGFDEDHSTLNEFWRLDLEQWIWYRIQLRGDVPAPRSGHSAMLYEGNIILFGGIKEIGHETNELFYYDLSSNVWTLIFHGDIHANRQELNLKHLPEENPNPASMRKSIYIRNSIKCTEEVKESLPQALKGNERVISVPCARDGHSASLICNQMYIFGGDKHQMSFNDLYLYSIDA